MSLTRLNKIIADAGITSRRGADDLIIEGRVTIDGIVIRELGAKFDPEMHHVQVDGETIYQSMSKTYLALHKPRGVLSTMYDPEGRPSLSDFIDLRTERLFHVGRLDKDSEGLILLTNDGDLTFRATHPSFGHIIRRLMEAIGVEVLRLVRTKFGPISLGDTPEGRWRDLNSGELISLQTALDIKL
jgi:23S rRNA pseudouridine2605 synthase